MPRKRTNLLVRCKYFSWKMFQRDGVWYADGRTNPTDAGRHSLETRDSQEAKEAVHELDAHVAVELGLASRDEARPAGEQLLSLVVGRSLYETHIKRPQTCGGLRKSTQKRYKAAFDKFIKFAGSIGMTAWNRVTNTTLDAFATHLEEAGYAPKTLRNELTTIVSTHKWLRDEGHLVTNNALRLKIQKMPGERRYCWTKAEVLAMVEYCRQHSHLSWLYAVITTLACTGMRISELVSLRWADVDFEHGVLAVVDESGRPRMSDRANRQVKGKRSRNIVLHVDLATLLTTMKATAHKDGFVFHGPRTGRLKADTVRLALIKDVLEPLAPRFPSKDGEPGFSTGRLHSFRHYFVSDCANNGIPELVTMNWLGHQDSEMVRHYYHLHDEEARRQMDRLNPLGNAGQQHTGVDRAAHNKKEPTSQDSDPKIAS